MSWGFQCEDGWFRLIWDLSQKIEEAATNEGMLPDHENWPEATEVKQKFGKLRFGLRNYSVAMQELTTSAQEISHGICEVCGEEGAVPINKRGFIQTLCLMHGHDSQNQAGDASKTPVWKLKKIRTEY